MRSTLAVVFAGVLAVGLHAGEEAGSASHLLKPAETPATSEPPGGAMTGPSGAVVPTVAESSTANDAKAPESNAAPRPAEPAARRTFTHDGVTFELANSEMTNTVETDEYVLAGEKIADWTQLVTVQRLQLKKLQSADEFVGYFQRQIQTEPGVSLEVLKSGRKASVFAVRFPKSDRNDEQVMICLAFLDSANPDRLNIVQYAVKPTRSPVAEVEIRIQSWRDKFLHQAEALSGNQSS